MKKLLADLLDDALLLLGGGCVLYGMALWNVPAMWIVGGLMLIFLAMMIGYVKGK